MYLQNSVHETGLFRYSKTLQILSKIPAVSGGALRSVCIALRAMLLIVSEIRKSLV